jgi:hypothetical protein
VYKARLLAAEIIITIINGRPLKVKTRNEESSSNPALPVVHIFRLPPLLIFTHELFSGGLFDFSVIIIVIMYAYTKNIFVADIGR